MKLLKAPVSTKLILAIDDEAAVLEVVQFSLQDIGGWKVVSATSGQEGFERALTEGPDAIVLDISMPGMDGKAFLEKLRANPVTQSIPVVLLTAHARWFNRQQLLEFGVAAAIAKPFNSATLPEQIAVALGWNLPDPIHYPLS